MIHHAVARNEQTDDEVIEGLRVGDADSYAQFLDVYGPRVIKRISVMRRSNRSLGVDPEDCLQHAVTKLIENRSNINFENLNHAGSWILRTAINYFLDQIRRNKHHLHYVENVLKTSQYSKDSSRLSELKIGLHALISRLEISDMRIIYFTFWEGLKAREIAEIEGMTTGQVRTRRHRVLRRLKRSFG